MNASLKISFIVVALNAENTLPFLLSDLAEQTLPHNQIEAVLVDSNSIDHTKQIMFSFQKTAPFTVLVIDNPKQWLASGCNLAISAATGDALIRVDAHARIPSDFLEKNLHALCTGESIVGGSVLSLPPRSNWGRVMHALDSSRFCGGAAPFRNRGNSRYVDTLAYALYRKQVFNRVGFYNERLRRTEDNEMHFRMRQAGYRFFFSPDIVSFHMARETLSGQVSQKWGNGYWIGRTMHIEPRCFSFRHFAPALFVTALIICLILAVVFSFFPLLFLLLCYSLLNLGFTVQAASKTTQSKFLTFICLPFLFPMMHLLYGLGTIIGMIEPEGKLYE